MQAEYDPVKDIRHFPMPMAKYGQNPYFENLYRIVLAPSVCNMVGGLWAGGELEYHWRPAYRHLGEVWILERWHACRMTKAQWDRDMVDPASGWLINGPYPARGQYELAWTFDKGVDNDNVEKIIAAIERGRSYSMADIDGVNRAEYEREEKETRTNIYDEIRDAFTAYGGRAFASSRVARGIKTAAPLMTAEEAGLPIPRAPQPQPGRIGNRRTVDVRDIQVVNNLTAGVTANA